MKVALKILNILPFVEINVGIYFSPICFLFATEITRDMSYADFNIISSFPVNFSSLPIPGHFFSFQYKIAVFSKHSIY